MQHRRSVLSGEAMPSVVVVISPESCVLSNGISPAIVRIVTFQHGFPTPQRADTLWLLTLHDDRSPATLLNAEPTSGELLAAFL